MVEWHSIEVIDIDKYHRRKLCVMRSGCSLDVILMNFWTNSKSIKCFWMHSMLDWLKYPVIKKFRLSFKISIVWNRILSWITWSIDFFPNEFCIRFYRLWNFAYDFDFMHFFEHFFLFSTSVQFWWFDCEFISTEWFECIKIVELKIYSMNGMLWFHTYDNDSSSRA